MKVYIICCLLIGGMLASCNISPNTKKKNTSYPFTGDYVSQGYSQRAEGYDWSVVSIKALSDSTSNITVRSRADIKEPTCKFDGIGYVSASGDTLTTLYDDGKIYFTLAEDTLQISSDTPQLLSFFCSGGGSLRGDYVKLHDKLDGKQLENAQ